MTRPRAFLRTALCRIPGPHAFGLIPWLIPLLFGLGGARVVTDGSHPPEWVRQIVIADVASWLVQGAVLLLIRRYALRLPPTPRGGLLALGCFAAIGIVGGLVQVLVLRSGGLPDPPPFTAPESQLFMATLTWVATGTIVGIAFSWRDQLADSLAAATHRADAARSVLGRSTALAHRQRAMVARLIRERIVPGLAATAAELRAPHDATATARAADQIEHIARNDVRGVAHLLHPLTAPTDLRSAIGPICRLFDIELELLPAGASPVVSADTASAVTVTIAELMLARDPAQGRPPLRLQIRETPTGPQLEFPAKRHAPLPLQEQHETEPSPSEAPRWFRIAPAPHGMPWVAIAGLNTFSVLAATLAADTGRWAATVPNIAVITLGTLALDRVLRLQRVQRLSVRGQWLVIGGWVATLGAVAGAVWGSAIGGEVDSLAVLGLICALGMGLFLPAMRVWSAEIRQLRNQLMLEDLDAEATTARLRAIGFERCTTAADGLHSSVQSQLLGVAGALGGDLPADLLDTAYAVLDEVTETTLPTIAAHLEAEAGRDEMPLLSTQALAATWPTAQISVQAPSELPLTARKLLDSVVVEAVGNAIHHGGADTVEITATLWPGAVGVTVDDNGCGIADGAGQGLGLTAIRSAANEFSLTKLPSGGTRLSVRLPYLA